MKNIVKNLLALAAFLEFTTAAFGQLHWSSYNNTGTLVTANVATGGDAPYGGSVTLTIPAASQLIFLTGTFAPVGLPAASSSVKINFSMSANGGLYPGSTGRLFGMGLLNNPGTASALDDTGYWVDFNTGNPSFELFDRPATVTTFFQYDSPDKLGSGTIKIGEPTNNVTYAMQLQVNMNSGASSVSLGTSTAWANTGAGMTNFSSSGVWESAYSSGVALTALATTNFNEFAFSFNNTSASSVNVTLSGITLTPANPEITSNPINFSGAAGSTATFTVVVNTNAAVPIGYQWYETNSLGIAPLANGAAGNGSTVSGATTGSSSLFTNTLTFSSAQVADSNGSIFVVMTNAFGSVTSAPVSINITSSDTAPTITSISFTNATVISGQNTNVVVSAMGSPSPAYYWYDNNNNLIQSGSSFTLGLTNLQLANAGTYSVIASNYLGTESTNFTIGIIVPPCISQQPSNVLVSVGDSVNFSVVEGGCALPAPTYQWYKNGTLISGATNTNYSITNVALTDIANYTVVLNNSAGAVTSSSAKLAVLSTSLAATAFSPANGASGVCYDTPLYVTFNSAVSIVNSGAIRIYNLTNLVTPVDIIDMSSNMVVVSGGIGLTNNIQPHSLFSGDAQVINYFPVIISGNTAAIYPHGGVLTSNQTYYVTVDSGIVADNTGAYFAGISDTNAWQFTTKPTGPVNPTNLVVAADGSGDFATVQGAVDSILPGNTNYSLVNIRNGNYVEIVDISGKSHITFRGQSRAGTLVGYANNNNLTGTTAGRMAIKVNSADIKFENLTLTNGTPQGGSQAETLLIYNNGQRCIVNNCDVGSRQDTILINASTSQGYFYNCKVVGNFDYIWGVGAGFFTNCVFHTITNSLSSSYNLTAARTLTSGTLSTATPWVNPNGTTYSANGLSFVNCTVEADSGVAGITLASSNGTAGGLDSWANCFIDTNAYVNPSGKLTNQYVFWQYNNNDITGTNPISYANLVTIGVTNNDPRLLAALNATTWLYGWTPQMAPNILTNPVSLNVNGGQSATFTVSATGIPDPSYQWLKNGTNLVGQTGASLTINNANVNDAATYSVIVSNTAGSVTSSTAVLAVGNTAPTLVPVSDQTINAGITLNVTNVATDPDVPPQVLTFALLSAPVNATLDSDTGIFTWRATVASAGTTNPVTLTVTDNGSPNLSATNSFNVIVNPVAPPATSSASYAGGQFSLTVNGDFGPDYILQVSTNLVDWQGLFTNSSPSLPFTFVDTNAAAVPAQFYRVLLGP